MYHQQSLGLTGYDNAPLSTTFFRHNDSNHLVVIYPGMAYLVQHPLLYYPTQLCLARSCEVLWVQYNYRHAVFQSLSSDEQHRWLAHDTITALEAGIAQRPYRQITLIGKSLGTVALGHVLASPHAPRVTASVWLTPILTDAQVVAQMMHISHPALLVTGTADPVYEAGALHQVCEKTGATSLVLDQADHLLEQGYCT